MKLTDTQLETAKVAWDSLDVSGYDIIELPEPPVIHPKFAYNERYWP